MPTIFCRWWARGVYHRARIRATRWLCPPGWVHHALAVIKHTSALSRRETPESLKKSLAQRGRTGMPGTSAPAASCAHGSGKSTRVFTASSPKSPGIPARDGFNRCFALSPEIGLSCLRRRRSELRQLDASVEASGPHDLAVRFSAARQEYIHVHRISSRVRDDRDTPLK